MASTETSLLLVGRIGRPHGVRGEVKIIPDTDDPYRFAELERLFIGDDATSAPPFALRSVRFQQASRGTIPLVAFEGYEAKETIDRFRNKLVFAAEEDLPPLDDDEFYIHDLIGCTVETSDGTHVGMLQSVLELPAHYVYIVSRKGLPDALIPAVPAFIEDVDVEEQRIVIRPIEGLLD